MRAVAYIAIAIAVLVAGHASADPRSHAGKTPKPLQHILTATAPAGTPANGGAFKGIRQKAIRDAAYTYALQTAVHWRYDQINNRLKGLHNQLNQVFDFSVLTMADGRVLPPVITQTESGWRKLSNTAAKSVSHEFAILHPARVISTPPTWQNYLIKQYPVNDKPNPVLYPKNDAERAIWKAAARNGWHSGAQLAFRLYQTNLNRLKRDYVGMILFRRLANQHIVSLPATADSKPRIAIDGHTLSVGQHIFRITLPATWRGPGHWTVEATSEQ